jgi:hypothetical protein
VGVKLARGEITSANDNGTYNVRLSGANDDMQNVPSLNMVVLPVGLSVVVDVSDDQAPHILSDSKSGSHWLGPSRYQPTVDTMLPGGWRYHNGTPDTGVAYSEPILPTKRYSSWSIPIGTDTSNQDPGYGKSGVLEARTASWINNNGVKRNAIISYAEANLSAGFLNNDYIVAWDAKNNYTLASPLAAPSDIVAPNPLPGSLVNVTASSWLDVGKVLLIYGTGYTGTQTNWASSNPTTSGSGGTVASSMCTFVSIGETWTGTSFTAFSSITKIDVYAAYQLPNEVLTTDVLSPGLSQPATLPGQVNVGINSSSAYTLTGSILPTMYKSRSALTGSVQVQCGNFNFTIPAGTSTYLVNRSVLDLDTAEGSENPYNSLQKGDMLLIDNEIMEVQGIIKNYATPVFGTNNAKLQVVVSGRGMFAGTPSAHAAGSNIRVIYWMTRVDSIRGYSGPMHYTPSYDTSSPYVMMIVERDTLFYVGLARYQDGTYATLFARDVKSGALLWANPLLKSTSFSGDTYVAYLGFADDTNNTSGAMVMGTVVVHERSKTTTATTWSGFNRKTGACNYRVSDASTAYVAGDQPEFTVCLPSSGIILQHFLRPLSSAFDLTGYRVFRTYDARTGIKKTETIESFGGVDSVASTSADGKYRTEVGMTRAYLPSADGYGMNMIALVRSRIWDRNTVSDGGFSYTYETPRDYVNNAICYKFSAEGSVTQLYATTMAMPTLISSLATTNASYCSAILGYDGNPDRPRLYVNFVERYEKELDYVVVPAERNLIMGPGNYPTNYFDSIISNSPPDAAEVLQKMQRFSFKMYQEYPLASRLLSIDPATGDVLGASSNFIDFPTEDQTNAYTVVNLTDAQITPDTTPASSTYMPYPVNTELTGFKYVKPLGFFFNNVSMTPGDAFTLRRWSAECAELDPPVGLDKPVIDQDYALEMWKCDGKAVSVHGILPIVSVLGMLFVGKLKYSDASINVQGFSSNVYTNQGPYPAT